MTPATDCGLCGKNVDEAGPAESLRYTNEGKPVHEECAVREEGKAMGKGAEQTAVVVGGGVVVVDRATAKSQAELALATAEERAKVAAGVIDKMHLFKTINGKKFVFVDGWTTLAALYNLAVSIEWTKRDEDGTVRARAQLVRIDTGVILPIAAESECGGEGDDTWIGRTAMAKGSMAQTRAMSKVCRMAFSWVMVLAGFQGTPAEEMPSDKPEPRGQRPRGPDVLQLRIEAEGLMQKAIKDETMSRAQMVEWVGGICEGVFVMKPDGQGALIHRAKLSAEQAKTIIASLLKRPDAEPPKPIDGEVIDQGVKQEETAEEPATV